MTVAPLASTTRPRLDSSAAPARVLGMASALPAGYERQDRITDALAEMWEQSGPVPEKLRTLHRRVGVDGRHLAVPLERYGSLSSFDERNAQYIEHGTALGASALSGALQQAGLTPADLEQLVFVSITGIATPSIDARVVNRLGINSRVRRTPIFGLGCGGGAAGLSRVADLAQARPGERVALLAVELCTLALRLADRSVANVIASGLFGDGAAAVIVSADGSEGTGPGVANGQPRPASGQPRPASGQPRPASGQPAASGDASVVQRRTGAPRLPSVVASRSVFYPDTEHVMGWHVGSDGLGILLSPGVPELAKSTIAPDILTFLEDHGVARDQVAHWVCHTGGPKVLDALEAGMELPPGSLDRSRESLRRVGNLSSASVLMVLESTLTEHDPRPGDLGLMLAMGPGFTAEMLLLAW